MRTNHKHWAKRDFVYLPIKIGIWTVSMLAQWFSKFASPSVFSSFGILRVKVHGNAPYHNFKPVLMNLAGGNIIIVLAIPLHIWIL